MHAPHKLLAALLLQSTLAASASAVDSVKIRDVGVTERDGVLEVSIRGDRAPSYSVFKLQEPPRLVIDMQRVDVTDVSSPIAVNKGGVVSVATAQYRDERNSVGRVIVTLDGPHRYDVVSSGDAVLVRVQREAAGAAPAAPVDTTAQAPAAAPSPAQAPPAAPAAAAAIAAEPRAPAAAPAAAPEADRPAPAAEATAQASPAQPADKDDNVVARRVDEARVGRAARAVLAARPTRGGVLIATDGGLPRIEITELRDPPRLALDLPGLARAPRGPVSLAGPFAGVRFGKGHGGVRVVLDASGELPAYRIQRVQGGLAVTAAPAAPAVAAAPAPAPAAPAPAALAEPPAAEKPAVARADAAEEAQAPAVRIGKVQFSGTTRTSRIEIGAKASYAVTRPDARTVVLTLQGAQLPKHLERSLDTSAFKGPVQMVSSFNQQGLVRVVATLDGPASEKVTETPAGLVWTFGAGAEPPAEIKAAGAEAAGFSAEAPGYAASGAPQAQGYTGRRITLEFHDIEIRNLLRLIADVSKKNIIVADDVTGKVTISLRNVPWDQALDLVLRSKGLGKEELGNVIRIAKLDDILKEQKARADAEKAKIPLAPLKVRLIPVNFAHAPDMAARIKDVLTERGTVSVDERTNVLIVKDIPEALVKAEGLVRNLDTEIPQVLIESRIVEASNNYNRALGVQWGGLGSMSQATNNPTGLVFPYNARVTGASDNTASTGVSSNPNYAVSLPAAIGQGSGGGLGFTFGTLSGAFNLNLRLSALENTGTVKTISAPRIATIDNKEATISQGISIPFSQASQNGTNTTFIDATLELKVTPHVTNDGNVVLKIKASDNAPNPGLTGANQQPSISKRQAETEVIVKDGDTTVIGGIYTRQLSSQRTGIPWLSKIPVLGYFFRSTTTEDDHTELLIFITPRILNRPAAATTAGSN